MNNPKMKKTSSPSIPAVDVYLERRKSREYVGRLTRVRTEGKASFDFEYNEAYLLKSNSIPLGPEFPLTKRLFHSKKLFPSFEDRIPSRENPAYPEYCRSEGISPDETDPIALLATIGRRGPSSFMYEPARIDSRAQTGLASFRKELSMTIREFAAAFDTSTATVQKLEIGKGSGKELLKRLEIYMRFPEVALYELKKNGARLHDSRYQEAFRRLEEKVKAKLAD